MGILSTVLNHVAVKSGIAHEAAQGAVVGAGGIVLDVAQAALSLFGL